MYDKAGTLHSAKCAGKIYNIIYNRDEEGFTLLLTLGAIYEAGRIQGIREQRLVKRLKSWKKAN